MNYNKIVMMAFFAACAGFIDTVDAMNNQQQNPNQQQSGFQSPVAAMPGFKWTETVDTQEQIEVNIVEAPIVNGGDFYIGLSRPLGGTHLLNLVTGVISRVRTKTTYTITTCPQNNSQNHNG